TRTTTVVRARRQRLLGLNTLALGDVKGAFGHLTAAVGIAGTPWPRSRLHLGVRCLVALGREILRRWVPWLPARAGADRELLFEAARAYERLLVVNYFSGDMPAVVLCALTNMGIAERAGGSSAERALGYATFAAMCALVPLHGAARSYSRRALDVVRDCGDEAAESWVLMNVALVNLQAGRWDEMRDLLEKVGAMARRMGFNRRREEALAQFSTASFLTGRFADAARLNQALTGTVDRADPQAKCWAVVRDAELRLIEGDVAGALGAAREGEGVCRRGL